MCMLTTQSGKIAKKDIVCYVVRRLDENNNICSLFQDNIWQVGVLYSIKEKSVIHHPSEIRGGFYHSFRYLKDAKYHICPEWKKYEKHTNKIFKAIIPKGSYYVLGMCDRNNTIYECYGNGSLAYVSKRLKLVEEVT